MPPGLVFTVEWLVLICKHNALSAVPKTFKANPIIKVLNN